MKRHSRNQSITALTVANSVIKLEDPLNQAYSLTRALMLAGLGMKALDVDQGEAVVALAEALSSVLATAKSEWQQAMTNLTSG